MAPISTRGCEDFGVGSTIPGIDAAHISKAVRAVELSDDQPIVLNEWQAGVAVEGVEQHNRAEDRLGARSTRCSTEANRCTSCSVPFTVAR